jgi:hypothetical protein
MASHRRPQVWVEFLSLFLSQFNSPIRTTQQQQERYECRQRENETINEFLIRLRAIWLEQKPKETEVDFIKHLLCKMRSELLSIMGISPSASLDEIIFAAQKVEEVLYRRTEEQCLIKCFKQTSFENNISATPEHFNGSYHINYNK